MKIAIDGPAGAGKSTIAKEVSKRLDFMYVDTGAMYRTIALDCINKGIGFADADEEAVSRACREADIEVTYENGAQHMYLDGEDVSKKIRREEVGNGASAASRFGAVRERLVQIQRELGEKYNVVMDGRDIGTVVLPDAEVKIFLTATAPCRAQRRYKEILARGEEADFDKILKDIEQRDYNDSHRAIAPLKPAEDSVIIDSSDMSIEQVTEQVLKLVTGADKALAHPGDN